MGTNVQLCPEQVDGVPHPQHREHHELVLQGTLYSLVEPSTWGQELVTTRNHYHDQGSRADLILNPRPDKLPPPPRLFQHRHHTHNRAAPNVTSNPTQHRGIHCLG